MHMDQDSLSVFLIGDSVFYETFGLILIGFISYCALCEGVHANYFEEKINSEMSINISNKNANNWFLFYFFLFFMSVCLSACLPACLSVRLSVCLSVGLSVCLSVCLSACLSVCLSVCMYVCMYVYYI